MLRPTSYAIIKKISKEMSALKKMIRAHRALFYALIPVPYIVVNALLFVAGNAMRTHPALDDLLWQCTGALSLTLFVLAPPCFVCTGLAGIYHAVQNLRHRKAVREHIIVLVAAAATVIASAGFFWWYWYARPI